MFDAGEFCDLRLKLAHFRSKDELAVIHDLRDASVDVVAQPGLLAVEVEQPDGCGSSISLGWTCGGAG